MPDLQARTVTGPAPAGAWAAGWALLRRRAKRHLVVVGLMCTGIAVLLTAMDDGGRFGIKLVYSLAIGACCTLIVDGLRLVIGTLQDRLRRRRSLPPDSGVHGWRAAGPAVLAAVLLGPSIGLWIGDQLTGGRSPSLLQLNSNSTRITLVLSLLGTAVAMFSLSTLERLAAARAQAEAAQRLAAENQLRLLQSQLEPHMLFNTLANLRVLIGLDPARAQAMLDHLIAFLRATLNASRNDAHPLSAEFAHLSDYLALMAVRMGPRLKVRLDLPDTLGQLPVPPLLLQPLVENAIKHGLEPKVEGGRIEVSALRDGAVLRLAVRDTGVGLGAAPSAASAVGSHFGLEQVRSRLATLYGSRAALNLQSAADGRGGVLATLELPLAA